MRLSTVTVYLILILCCACNVERRPNIILIMVDDMGYEALAINGGLSYETPHLDSLAQAGIRFTHAFSTPLCTPSRVQIMTGKYSFRNYIGFGLLDPAEQTFGHLLQEAGYATAIVGKWQLYGDERQRNLAGRGGTGPDSAGFDEFALWQYRDRGNRFRSPTIHYSGRELETFPDDYGPDLFMDFIGDFAERHQDTPFFLYYPMVLTHSPFLPTPDHPDYQLGDSAQAGPAYFAANVEYMDAVVGRITAKLHELELDQRTLVLFTSDNGTARNITSEHERGPIRGRKGYSVAAGTHVPLIAYWPGTIAPGSISEALVDFTDFLPTLVEAAGSEMPPGFVADGLSFYGQLTGGADTTRHWIYNHYAPQWGNFVPTRYAQDQTWKLYADGRFVNWKEDPAELTALPDSTLDSTAMQAKEKLQRVLQSMPALAP